MMFLMEASSDTNVGVGGGVKEIRDRGDSRGSGITAGREKRLF